MYIYVYIYIYIIYIYIYICTARLCTSHGLLHNSTWERRATSALLKPSLKLQPRLGRNQYLTNNIIIGDNKQHEHSERNNTNSFRKLKGWPCRRRPFRHRKDNLPPLNNNPLWLKETFGQQNKSCFQFAPTLRRAASFRKLSRKKWARPRESRTFTMFSGYTQCRIALQPAASFPKFNLEKWARPLGDLNFQSILKRVQATALGFQTLDLQFCELELW